MKDKKPLYRKVNTRARNCRHNTGSEAKYDRNTKGGLKKSMKRGVERGLDYTPLYMFLLSKIGEDWDVVYSEAVQRLKGADKDAIYHLVRDKESTKYGHVRCGESSLYSVLFVDENNQLQKVRPDITNEKLYPTCPCCTHTFNGKVFVNKYNPEKVGKNLE